jgi:hypothetical protein
MIEVMDSKLDKFETVEFHAAVDQRSKDLDQSLAHTVDRVHSHDYWKEAKEWLANEKALSPILLDRLKRYAFAKIPPNVEHYNDLEALAILLLIDDVYGKEAPEFRAALTIAKNLKNPWWSWQWILSNGVKP